MIHPIHSFASIFATNYLDQYLCLFFNKIKNPCIKTIYTLYHTNLKPMNTIRLTSSNFTLTIIIIKYFLNVTFYQLMFNICFQCKIDYITDLTQNIIFMYRCVKNCWLTMQPNTCFSIIQWFRIFFLQQSSS